MEINLHSTYIILFLTIVFIIVNLSTAKIKYNVQEREALVKFRPLVNDIVNHEYQKIDSYLIRYLRAKNLNIQASVELLREAQKWRADKMVESPVNASIPGLPKIDLIDKHTVDYEGRLVLISNVADVDARRIVLGGNLERFLKFQRHYYDKNVAKAATNVLESNGTLTDSRIINLINLHGISLRKHGCLSCIRIFTSDASIYEKYYPGTVAHVIYINTPRFALQIVELISSFASAETRNIIKVFGTDRKEWSEYIHKIISPDQITYQHGGTKKD